MRTHTLNYMSCGCNNGMAQLVSHICDPTQARTTCELQICPLNARERPQCTLRSIA